MTIKEIIENFTRYRWNQETEKFEVTGKYNFEKVTEKINSSKTVNEAINAVILYNVMAERFRKLL